MFKKLLIFIFSVNLAACQPSEAVLQKAIQETQAAAPTETSIPTPTSIPLKDIDLSSVIFQTGDLPTGYTPGQVRSEGIGEVKSIKEISINEYHQEVSYQGALGGRISLFLYDTKDQARNAFDQLTNELESDNWVSKQIDNLGEDSYGQEIYVPLLLGLDPIQASRIVFVRCNALVYANLELAESYSGLVDYAKHLDERLVEMICQ